MILIYQALSIGWFALGSCIIAIQVQNMNLSFRNKTGLPEELVANVSKIASVINSEMKGYEGTSIALGILAIVIGIVGVIAVCFALKRVQNRNENRLVHVVINAVISLIGIAFIASLCDAFVAFIEEVLTRGGNTVIAAVQAVYPPTDNDPRMHEAIGILVGSNTDYDNHHIYVHNFLGRAPYALLGLEAVALVLALVYVAAVACFIWRNRKGSF